MSVPTIPEFFTKKNVLITGVTGFLGKVLLEKLLRSCPEVQNIYLIIKSKRGKDPQSRVKDLINLPVFDVVRMEKPGFEKKIITIEGDVSELRLGLSEEDYTVLTEKINIVFHVAATVQFNEPMYAPIMTNTRGTKELVELCLKMKSLEVLLFVSTAYANCNKHEIEEIVYPPYVDWKDAIEICEKVDPAVLYILQEKYMGDLPNPYILSKNLAEHVIWDNIYRLPVVIFRPSVVIASWQEPFPGWVDSTSGLTGIILAQSTGLVYVVLSDPKTALDCVPVDIAAKTMIVAAWQRAVLSSQGMRNTVYNCTSVIPPVTNDEINNIGPKLSDEYPITNVAWYPGKVRFTTSRTIYKILHLIQHVLLAILIDTVLKITGQKPKLVRMQRKIYQTVLAISYFATKSWTFKTHNFVSLNEQILAKDKKDFYYDLSSFDIETYSRHLGFGVRKYILHDDMENITVAKRKMSRMYWADKVMKAVVLGLALWMIDIIAWMQYFGTTITSFVLL